MTPFWHPSLSTISPSGWSRQDVVDSRKHHLQTEHGPCTAEMHAAFSAILCEPSKTWRFIRPFGVTW